METIICTLCETEKPISEFYKNNKTANGYANQCKECVKTRAKAREEKLRQDPDWIEKERKRGREKYYRLDYREKNKPSRESKKEIIKRHNAKYPEKLKAKYMSSNIKTIGEKHHWSYNKEHYKDIIDLDTHSHNKLHRYMIYDQERMMYRCIKSIGIFEANELLDTRERHIMYLSVIKNLD